jgi:hypothetical protein
VTHQDQYAYVMSEWEQSWIQFRHLETMRGQYLGFFFTAVLGVTAIAGPGLIEDSLRTTGSLQVLAALTLSLQALTGFLYLAVTRINAALAFHQRRIFAIRDVMIPASSAIVDLSLFARPPTPPKDWARTSGVATHVLNLGLMAFPIVLAGALARSTQVSGLSVTTVSCLVGLLVGVVVGLVARLGGGRPELPTAK